GRASERPQSKRGVDRPTHTRPFWHHGRMATPWTAHPLQFAGLNGAGSARTMYLTFPCSGFTIASFPDARNDTKIVDPRTAMLSGSSLPAPGVGSKANMPSGRAPP